MVSNSAAPGRVSFRKQPHSGRVEQAGRARRLHEQTEILVILFLGDMRVVVAASSILQNVAGNIYMGFRVVELTSATSVEAAFGQSARAYRNGFIVDVAPAEIVDDHEHALLVDVHSEAHHRLAPDVLRISRVQLLAWLDVLDTPPALQLSELGFALFVASALFLVLA